MSKRENELILRKITDAEKWHYLSVKNLPTLVREIASKNNGNYFCINCLDSSRAESKLKSHEAVYKNHNCCDVKMFELLNKILKDIINPYYCLLKNANFSVKKSNN